MTDRDYFAIAYDKDTPFGPRCAAVQSIQDEDLLVTLILLDVCVYANHQGSAPLYVLSDSMRNIGRMTKIALTPLPIDNGVRTIARGRVLRYAWAYEYDRGVHGVDNCLRAYRGHTNNTDIINLIDDELVARAAVRAAI